MTTINGCPGYRAHLSNHEDRAPSGAGLSVKYFLHFFCSENAEIYFIDRALGRSKNPDVGEVIGVNDTI